MPAAATLRDAVAEIVDDLSGHSDNVEPVEQGTLETAGVSPLALLDRAEGPREIAADIEVPRRIRRRCYLRRAANPIKSPTPIATASVAIGRCKRSIGCSLSGR
jgi:hypothetical protein